jgi:prolyl oligopeptidase
LIRLDVPTDAGISVHREWLLIRPRTDWAVGMTMYPAGFLLAAKYDEFLAGTVELSVIFEPDEHSSLENFAWARDHLVLVTLVDVASRVELVTPGSWERAPIAAIPPNTTPRRRRVDGTATRCSWTPAVSTSRPGCCGAEPVVK